MPQAHPTGPGLHGATWTFPVPRVDRGAWARPAGDSSEMVAPDRWAANTGPVVQRVVQSRCAPRHRTGSGDLLVARLDRKGFRWEVPWAALISFRTAACQNLPARCLLALSRRLLRKHENLGFRSRAEFPPPHLYRSVFERPIMAHKNQRQPEQLAPPVQRMRLRYAKRSVARFTSHRDFARSFERVLLRARIPMALSSGFNPHPRISYANASATGAASEAEYLEIALWEVCDPEKVKDALNAEMPTGMEVLEVVESDRAPWTEVLTASAWTVRVSHSTDPAAVSSAVDALLASSTWVVQRMTKSGLRDFDVRGALIGLGADGDLVRMMIRHQTPLVRPDDVMGALGSQIDGFDRQGCLFTRLYQGRVGLLEDGTADERGLRTALIDAFDGRAVQVW